MKPIATQTSMTQEADEETRKLLQQLEERTKELRAILPDGPLEGTFEQSRETFEAYCFSTGALLAGFFEHGTVAEMMRLKVLSRLIRERSELLRTIREETLGGIE